MIRRDSLLRGAALRSVFLLIVAAVAGPAPAQPLSEPAGAGEGRVVGRVVDGESAAPVEGVTVVLNAPAPAAGGEPRQELATTNADGAFAFERIPAGRYRIDFSKSGYRAASLADFEVLAGQDNRADFPLPPRPPESPEEAAAGGDIEVMVVHTDKAHELLSALERRTTSDEMVNVLGAGDLSKFAAVDMADALKRVAGVNVVDGQFAIIRGLEDRYSSTLYNGAPVPSPDPERQSVQLDLFPSSIRRWSRRTSRRSCRATPRAARSTS
ncbi:MAG: hypothetical protein E6J87_09300 [Deltaproteobacteria bacterium]|nr:MAG: hypothetical protein E6J87_09300 [Deltaproteobacteria bacterium]